MNIFLQENVASALEVYQEIKLLEAGRLKVLNDKLDALKKLIQMEMQKESMESVDAGDKGKILMIERKGVEKVDVKGLEKRFGLEIIAEFKQRGENIKYLKFVPLAPQE